MLAFIKKRRVSFALLLWFSLVFLISYLSLGRTVKNPTPLPLTHTPTNPRMPDRSTPRKLSDPNPFDSDDDGIPDAAELRTFMDRGNFRRWFTGIAELQFYHLSSQWNAEQLSSQWNAEQRDCAGLVRFAWRETLRKHDRQWFQKMGPGYDTIAPDISGDQLDQSPLSE